MKRIVSSLLSLPLLAACALAPQPLPGSSLPPASRTSAPSSDVTVRGVVRPIQVKLYDVGTHVLVDGRTGEPLYILASSVVDLGMHLGEEVSITGTTMPLGNGSDTLLSVSTLTKSDGTKAVSESDDVLVTAKRLAASFNPPYIFAATDVAEVVSTTADVTVVRVHQQLADYRLTLRQQDGAWSLSSVDVLPPTAPAASVTPSSVSVVPTSTPDPTSITPASSSPVSSTPEASTPPASTPASVAPQSVKSDSPTVTSLVSNVESYLSGLSFSGPVRVTKVSTTEKQQAYIELTDGTTRGMVLVSWGSDPASATVLATFVPGDVSDWKKLSGDNVARSEALTVYSLSSGAWTAEVQTKPGFAVYKNAGLKLTMQYPSQWYYSTLTPPSPATSRIAFSNKPVAPENTLLTLDVVPGSIDVVINGYSGVAPATINGQSGFKGTISTGATVVILPRNATSVYVLTAMPDAAGRIDDIASTITGG